METHKFKVGDRVRRTNFGLRNFKIGDIGIIVEIYSRSIYLKEHGSFTFDSGNFELAEIDWQEELK